MNGGLRAFRVVFVMRYTRISCMPFLATYPGSRFLQAQDEQDAVRQACLCLDRDLEQVLSGVNAINVSEVVLEVSRVEATKERDPVFWNPTWFGPEQTIPPHVIVR